MVSKNPGTDQSLTATQLVAEGREIEKKAEAGLTKLTNDIIAIVGIVLALVAFGFAIWAAVWAWKANDRATAQAKQFAEHTDQFLETIQAQTSRINELVDRVDSVFPPPLQQPAATSRPLQRTPITGTQL